MFVIFDLDGTLANVEHRVHHLEQKDWDSFDEACDADAPCLPLIKTAAALFIAGHRVEIWSGRSDAVARKTADWIETHGLRLMKIRMRQANDYRPDTLLKAGWLDEVEALPDLVFEDRASMVEMYRGRGILCAQVAPGEF